MSAHFYLLSVYLLVSLTSFVLILASPSLGDRHAHLRGQQIWRFTGEGVHNFVADIMSSREAEVDLMNTEGTTGATLRLLTPQAVSRARELLTRTKGVTEQVAVEDVAQHLLRTDEKGFLLSLNLRSEGSQQVCENGNCPRPLTDAYMTFEQMEFYLKELQKTRSSHVTLTSLGKTVEGRDIWLVKIDAQGQIQNRNFRRPAVWIEGGLHAREWISPITSLHLIDKLSSDCSPNCDVAYYVVPMANPDGYVYSTTTDRLWRKNRSVNPWRPYCVGVDLNRNWDYIFGVGASSNPCSDIYKGPKYFSERETSLLKEEMIRINNEHDLKLVLLIHSYGNKLIYPWGFTNSPIEDQMVLQRVGEEYQRAVRETTGTNILVGNSAADLYFASGATDDWSKKRLGTKLVYTLELRSGPGIGFILPENEIGPTATETYAGLLALLTEMRKL